MLLEEKMKNNPTVEGQHRCEACGNNWFFAMGEMFECTTCGNEKGYQWKQINIAIGKWTLTGWIHQHQDEKKCVEEYTKSMTLWDHQNNWKTKKSTITVPTNKESWKHEKGLDQKGERGSTISQREFEVTDETIEQVRNGQR